MILHNVVKAVVINGISRWYRIYPKFNNCKINQTKNIGATAGLAQEGSKTMSPSNSVRKMLEKPSSIMYTTSTSIRNEYDLWWCQDVCLSNTTYFFRIQHFFGQRLRISFAFKNIRRNGENQLWWHESHLSHQGDEEQPGDRSRGRSHLGSSSSSRLPPTSPSASLIAASTDAIKSSVSTAARRYIGWHPCSDGSATSM